MDNLKRTLLASEHGVSTSRVGRLFSTGLRAGGLARAVLSRNGGDMTAIVRGLGELKGVAMKAGQILSFIDPTLPPELRDALAVLQTASPASPFATVEATVRSCLGPRADALLAQMDRAPIAVASIGQVHRAGDLAVKVRHPGIDRALEADFASATIGSSLARLFAPGASVEELVAEARTAMLEECNFRLEAARQQHFAELYRQHPTIAIPRVVPDLSGDAVLTTAWSPGRSLDDFLARDPAQSLRDRFGAALFELYLGTLYRHGVFHADPHPGNYAFCDDGRLVIYDFGCVRTFDAESVRAVRALAGAVRMDDRAAIVTALGELGATPERVSFDRLRAMLRGFFAPVLSPGRHRIEPGAALEAQSAFADKRTLMKLSLPGKLLFLLRIRFGLYAVLARLGSEADWSDLEASSAHSQGLVQTSVPQVSLRHGPVSTAPS